MLPVISILSQIQSDAVAISFIIIILGVMIVGALPTIIAFCKSHPNRWVILGINFFFGATGVGWFIALIWALNLIKIDPKKIGSGDNK